MNDKTHVVMGRMVLPNEQVVRRRSEVPINFFKGSRAMIDASQHMISITRDKTLGGGLSWTARDLRK